jgi:hypothetical protein
MIDLKSHCRGVVIMVRDFGYIVKEGYTLAEIEVGLDEGYLLEIRKTLFLEDFKKRISIICQHDDFDDFDTISIKRSNSVVAGLMLYEDESKRYSMTDIEINFTFIGTKFYLTLNTTHIKINIFEVLMSGSGVEAIIIFEDNIKMRYQMQQKTNEDYGKILWMCDLSYDDMCLFATKSFVKAKIAGTPVSFTTKRNDWYPTFEMGQVALKYMAASLLKYVAEKYPNKYDRILVQKAKTIHEMYSNNQ